MTWPRDLDSVDVAWFVKYVTLQPYSRQLIASKRISANESSKRPALQKTKYRCRTNILRYLPIGMISPRYDFGRTKIAHQMGGKRNAKARRAKRGFTREKRVQKTRCKHSRARRNLPARYGAVDGDGRARERDGDRDARGARAACASTWAVAT